jgi:hypothetical protein
MTIYSLRETCCSKKFAGQEGGRAERAPAQDSQPFNFQLIEKGRG